MGSVGENFRDYLQNRTDLSEAEQDMLAANDFDRWSGREREEVIDTTTPLRDSDVDRLESRYDSAHTTKQLNTLLDDVNNGLGRANMEQRERLMRLKTYIEDELREER